MAPGMLRVALKSISLPPNEHRELLSSAVCAPVDHCAKGWQARQIATIGLRFPNAQVDEILELLYDCRTGCLSVIALRKSLLRESLSPKAMLTDFCDE